MKKVKVLFGGQTIEYPLDGEIQYSHDRQKYFGLAKTNSGNRLVTSFSKRGPYKFGPDVEISPLLRRAHKGGEG